MYGNKYLTKNAADNGSSDARTLAAVDLGRSAKI
jgi:hypothetical protein